MLLEWLDGLQKISMKYSTYSSSQTFEMLPKFKSVEGQTIGTFLPFAFHNGFVPVNIMHHIQFVLPMKDSVIILQDLEVIVTVESHEPNLKTR